MRTRFAPSPTGRPHPAMRFFGADRLGSGAGVRRAFLLRIEDIDRTRCRPEFEAAILADPVLARPVLAEPVRQSERQPLYAHALDWLEALGLSRRCSRAEIRRPAARRKGRRPRSILNLWPAMAERGLATRWLDLGRALALAGPLGFTETGLPGPAVTRSTAPICWPLARDVVLARRDIGTAYHPAVVVDDAPRRSPMWCAAPISGRRRPCTACSQALLSACPSRSGTITR